MAQLTFAESQDIVRQQFAAHAPWISQFTISGVDSGGWFNVLHDLRPEVWLARIAQRDSILECGSLEGGHTALLARYPGVLRVVGLEARAANLAKCRLIHHLLGITNSEFRECDLETFDLKSLGDFSATFCSGVFYHLARPVAFFQKITSPFVFLGTHYCRHAVSEFEGMRGCWYSEHDQADVLSGLSDRSFWLTLEGILEMVANCGYIIDDIHTSDQPNGPWVDIALTKRPHHTSGDRS